MNQAVLNMFSLEGKVALITGASSGLGQHFAKTLGQAGARVILGARREGRLAQLVDQLREQGIEAEAQPLDVTSRESIVKCLAAIRSQWGALDIVVNNAGVSDTKRVLAYNDQEWDSILNTNLKGAWMVAQESARYMVELGRPGSVINITSILGHRVGGGVGPYSAAKAGLSHLTRSMALELARYDVRVNAIAPGYVETEINQGFLASEPGQRLIQRIPTRRFSNLKDLDGALLLLASDAGSGMTGSEVVVDGGHSCSGL